MMMRIVFYIPPFFRLLGSHNNRVGPSIMATAGMMYKKGHSVTVINGDAIQDSEEYADWRSIYENYPAFVEAAKEFEKGTHALLQADLQAIAKIEPDVVVLCCGDPAIPTVDMGAIEVVAACARSLRTQNARVIGYGAAFSLNPALASLVHGVVHGYAEGSYEGFMAVAHLGKSSRVCQISPEGMDDLPLFLPQLVRDTPMIENYDYIMGSRGCLWHRCVFCIQSGSNCGTTYVDQSPSVFVKEILWRMSMGIKQLYFADMDFFGHSDAWLAEFYNLMQQKGLQELTWSCEARAESISPMKVRNMKKVGLRTVKIGVEGASSRLLNLYNKGTTMFRVMRACTTVKEEGVKLVCYLLLGHPDATEEMYVTGLQNAKELQADHYVLNVACPYVGTPLYGMIDKIKLKEMGLIDESGIEHGFTHLSHDLLKFWGIPLGLFEEYLELSMPEKKEDAGVGGRKFVRRILT